MAGSSRPPSAWRYDFAGIRLVDPADSIDAKQYPLATNVRALGEHTVQTRPGYVRLVNELIITAVCPLAQGVVGIPYSSTLTATGGVTPYTWDIDYADLPDGLSLDPDTGIISGTPTTQGDYPWQAIVTDALGATDTIDCSIFIDETLAINVACPSIQPVINEPYSYQLTAIGGTLPYTWTISAGSLPTGITLNASTGLISGTPTVSGTFPWTATVTDSAGPPNTASLACEFDIDALPDNKYYPDNWLVLNENDTCAGFRGTFLYCNAAVSPTNPDGAIDGTAANPTKEAMYGTGTFLPYVFLCYYGWSTLPVSFNNITIYVDFAFNHAGNPPSVGLVVEYGLDDEFSGSEIHTPVQYLFFSGLNADQARQTFSITLTKAAWDALGANKVIRHGMFDSQVQTFPAGPMFTDTYDIYAKVD